MLCNFWFYKSNQWEGFPIIEITCWRCWNISFFLKSFCFLLKTLVESIGTSIYFWKHAAYYWKRLLKELEHQNYFENPLLKVLEHQSFVGNVYPMIENACWRYWNIIFLLEILCRELKILVEGVGTSIFYWKCSAENWKWLLKMVEHHFFVGNALSDIPNCCWMGRTIKWLLKVFVKSVGIEDFGRRCSAKVWKSLTKVLV